MKDLAQHLSAAYNMLNNASATETEVIDAAIYQIKAVERLIVAQLKKEA